MEPVTSKSTVGFVFSSKKASIPPPLGQPSRRQDEIGPPLAVTADFGTLGEDSKQGEKDTVTIRDRDTLEQIRVPVGGLREALVEKWQK